MNCRFDGHHGDETDDARTDKGQADQPDGTQGADGPEDPVPAEAGHDTAGQPGADESTEAGGGEGEGVLPGWEPELAKQEHGQQRLGGHDQTGDEHLVEVERPQTGVAHDVSPAVEQWARPDRALDGRPRRFFLAADRGDAQRGEEVAERVGHHGGDRPEQADRRPAQPTRWRAPGR